MTRPVDIACIQTRPMPDFDSAIAEAVPLIDAAVQSGAELILLPEYCGGLRAENGFFRPPAAPEGGHPVLQEFRKLAAEHQIWILVGSLAVTGSGDKITNRGFLIDDLGHIHGSYDKIHMFDIQLSDDDVYLESATVRAGALAQIYDTPFGRIGHTICYDLRFPRLYRELALAGAEILAVPAAFLKSTGEAHWHVLNRARAIENGAYVVAPCAVGTVEGAGEVYGHSLVVNPWGEVEADGGTLPGIVQTRIDLDKVSEARAKIPSLDHDRDFKTIRGTHRKPE